MSTILAYTSPAIGHLFPMVPLLLELKARGHEVHACALPDQIHALQGAGLDARPIDRRLPGIGLADYRAGNPRAALASSVETFTGRARFDAPDLRAAMDTVKPDLLVVDINSWGARIVAEASGLPWATFSPYTPPLTSRGTPPFGPGLDPMPGPLGRVRDALARRLVIGAVEKHAAAHQPAARPPVRGRPCPGQERRRNVPDRPAPARHHRGALRVPAS